MPMSAKTGSDDISAAGMPLDNKQTNKHISAACVAKCSNSDSFGVCDALHTSSFIFTNALSR